MKLLSGELSLFGRKVEIALREKGLAYERVMVPFTQSEGYRPKHPEVLRVNPKGQVPVLIDGDVELYDSTVILEYLEDAYPTPPLYPGTAAGRAKCRLLELFADEILLAPVRLLMFRNTPRSGSEERQRAEDAAAEKGEAGISAHHAELDRRLSNREFLCGAFSVADIAVFMPVLYALRLGGPSLAAHSGLSAWYDRLRSRPAFSVIRSEILAADRKLSIPVSGPGDP